MIWVSELTFEFEILPFKKCWKIEQKTGYFEPFVEYKLINPLTIEIWVSSEFYFWALNLELLFFGMNKSIFFDWQDVQFFPHSHQNLNNFFLTAQSHSVSNLNPLQTCEVWSLDHVSSREFLLLEEGKFPI